MAGKTNRALASLLLRRSAGIANLFPASTRIRSEWRPCRTWRVNLRVAIKRGHGRFSLKGWLFHSRRSVCGPKLPDRFVGFIFCPPAF